MHLGNLRTCDKRRLVDRVNEEIATAQARREKLLASLSFDELAVYRVAAARVIYERYCRDTETDVGPNRTPDPEREALAEQFMRMIEQANNRFIELENDGRISAIVERLEGLGLLPVWLDFPAKPD